MEYKAQEKFDRLVVALQKRILTIETGSLD